MNTKIYNLPAKTISYPARTVVRIPLTGISTGAFMKEIKKNSIPTTARMRLLRTLHGREARFEWPTSLTA